MEKIIIFGGSGFLGSWIVKAFLKKGYSVSIFDLKIQKELLSHVVGNDINKIKFINGDITNYDHVQEAINDMDHVINLAGLMTPDCSSNPILGAKVNVLGSINVFEALKKNNNKFLVYASSAGVFGQKDHYYPFPETHYGAYKLAVEGVARAYLNEDGISSVGIRPYVIYGPGREVGGTAGVTLACKAAKQGDSYTVNFSGKAGFVYVQDVVDLVEMSIGKIPSGALTLNINGITADVSDFINLIKKNIPLSDIGIEGDPLSVVDEIRGNEPFKTFKKFKYTSLEDGIKRTIDFY
jgi:nucleoside-diphosphate-sugar epimerase|tara:strand:+ start:6462 stop:7346 length:885 start_codon:yes stop_codon:yes gene_type:complete